MVTRSVCGCGQKKGSGGRVEREWGVAGIVNAKTSHSTSHTCRIFECIVTHAPIEGPKFNYSSTATAERSRHHARAPTRTHARTHTAQAGLLRPTLREPQPSDKTQKMMMNARGWLGGLGGRDGQPAQQPTRIAHNTSGQGHALLPSTVAIATLSPDTKSCHTTTLLP